MNKIDTHQHLLYPDRFGYSWAKGIPALEGSFHLEDYGAAAAGCDMEGTLFMEVDVDPGQDRQEAEFFSALASEPSNRILGIVARVCPEEPDFETRLDAIAHPALKGIRRVLHTQNDALSASTSFRENVSRLAPRGLSFDLCVLQRQLTIALELVQACPEVRFIVDHCGIPDIAAHKSTQNESRQQWLDGIRALGKQPNTACKFSGITAYASPEQRTIDGIRPYLSEILEAFGPGRIVWGGDWPVCNLADGLESWSRLTDQLIGELSVDEQQDILRGNARSIYKL